jgi:hypothetical protein
VSPLSVTTECSQSYGRVRSGCGDRQNGPDLRRRVRKERWRTGDPSNPLPRPIWTRARAVAALALSLLPRRHISEEVLPLLFKSFSLAVALSGHPQPASDPIEQRKIVGNYLVASIYPAGQAFATERSEMLVECWHLHPKSIGQVPRPPTRSC